MVVVRQCEGEGVGLTHCRAMQVLRGEQRGEGAGPVMVGTWGQRCDKGGMGRWSATRLHQVIHNTQHPLCLTLHHTLVVTHGGSTHTDT